MKLSMWIFADWLKEFRPRSDIRSDHFEISAVRLFSSEITPEKGTMYIGRLRDLFKNGNDSIICVHDNDMLYLDTTELENVLNCVLDALSFYTGWDNSMMNLLTSGAMLQDFADASAAVLAHPFFILDSGQRHLAHNQNYQTGEVDELWDYLLENGSCNIDFLIRFNRFDPQRMTRRGIYTYDEPIFPNHAYHYNFIQDNSLLGTVTLIDLNSDISQGKLDCFQIFCSYIDRWFQLHIMEEESLILNAQIRNVISNQHADTAELRRRLILNDWKETDLLLFYKLDAPYQPFNINTYLCHTLSTNFSNLFAVTNRISICLLCNISQISREETEKRLKPWLEGSKYYATAGQPFTMSDSFFCHYQYVDMISSFAEGVPGCIYNGKNYTLSYLFAAMQTTVIPDILHPVLKKLRAYDEQHHTEFYTTLYYYLKNGRGIADTARELNLHRNTLLYRIKRLNELVEDDLDDYLIRLHILISYEIDKNRDRN